MLCTRPAPALAAFRTPQKVDSIVRQGFWRLLRQAGLRTREGKPDGLRFPMHHLPRPFARAVVLDATLRPSGWLLRGGKAAVHLHSPTVAGAVGELRRFRPRTPFPFHPSALLNGHLLHRFGLGDVPSIPVGPVLRVACCVLLAMPAPHAGCRACQSHAKPTAKKRTRFQAAILEKTVGEECGRAKTSATMQVAWARNRKPP